MNTETKIISRAIAQSAKCELFANSKLNANAKAYFPDQPVNIRNELSDYPILNANSRIFVPKQGDGIRQIRELDGNVGQISHDLSHPIFEDESSENFSDVEYIPPYKILDNLRVKNMNRIIFAHLNINSIRNKFDMLSDLIRGKIDILLISETKLDETFPSSQFLIPGFSIPYRLDRKVGGGKGEVLCCISGKISLQKEYTQIILLI